MAPLKRLQATWLLHSTSALARRWWVQARAATAARLVSRIGALRRLAQARPQSLLAPRVLAPTRPTRRFLERLSIALSELGDARVGIVPAPHDLGDRDRAMRDAPPDSPGSPSTTGADTFQITTKGRRDEDY